MSFWKKFLTRRKPSAPEKRTKKLLGLDCDLARASYKAAARGGAWDEADRLIAEGAVSCSLEEGHSALFWAALAGNLEMVRAMAPRAGATGERFGQTALMAACSRGHVEIAKLLMSATERMASDGNGLSALSFAASSGCAELVDALLAPTANGWAPGKNERWLAACIAAAMFDTKTLAIFEQRGWSESAGLQEEWSSYEIPKSLACAAISGKIIHPGFMDDDNDEFFAYSEGICHESWDIRATLAICQKTSMAEEDQASVIKKAIDLDFSVGAPPMPSDWAGQAFAASAKRSFSGYAEIMERCPDLPQAKGTRGGVTPLMIAAYYGPYIPIDLLERSDVSATDDRGWSAMRHFLARGRAGFAEPGQGPSIFCELGERATKEEWASEEEWIWRDLIQIAACSWSDPLLASMKLAIARSSPQALSRALAIAVAEGSRPAIELLFPLTCTSQNNEAFVQEFIHRNVKSPEISALVAERSSVLREVEELGKAAGIKTEQARLPAKRL